MKANKVKDFICNNIAYMLPRRVLYWMIIRVWADLTATKFSNKHPDEVTWSMAIENLELVK